LNVLAGRIHLDFHSDDPIFLQIARQIEALVAEETFRPGDQLPTVRELAIDLRINFSTVARAYRYLDEQRLISTQRGRGTYIEEPADRGSESAQEGMADADAAEQLAGLTQRFVRQAAQLGASPEQIRRIFKQQLDIWRHDHPAEPGRQTGG